MLLLLGACVIWVGDGPKPGDTVPPGTPSTSPPWPGTDTGSWTTSTTSSTSTTSTSTPNTTTTTKPTPYRLSVCLADGTPLTETWRSAPMGGAPIGRIAQDSGLVALGAGTDIGMFVLDGGLRRPEDLAPTWTLTLDAPVVDLAFEASSSAAYTVDADGTLLAWQLTDGQVLDRVTVPGATAVAVPYQDATVSVGSGWATWGKGGSTASWEGLLDQATTLGWSSRAGQDDLALAGTVGGAGTVVLVDPSDPATVKARWTTAVPWAEGGEPTAVRWGDGALAVATGPQPYSTVAVLRGEDLSVIAETTFEGLGVARLDTNFESSWFWGAGERYLTAFAWDGGGQVIVAELDVPAADLLVDPSDWYVVTVHDDGSLRRWGCE